MKLQDISKKIGSGMTPLRTNTEYWNSKDIPWVKTELLGQYIISETSEYISQKAFEENSLTLFPANTLSIAMYGEGKTRGNVSIFGMPMTSNQACCNLIIDEQKADYKYVYYALKNNYDNLRNLASGVRNNLNADLIKNFEIPLPDLPTQKKIADVLSCIDDKIALNNKTNTELENMAKTIYDYWFTQFDFPDKNGHPYKTSGGQMVYNEILKREIPAGWEVGKLSDIAEVFNGSTPSTKEDDNYGGNIVWITPKDLSDQQRKFTWYGERNITEKGYKDCNTTLVPKGTVLLSSRAPIGLVSIAACELCTNQGFKNIVPKNSVFQNYIYYVIKTNIPKIEQLGSGTTFKEVSKQSMESFKVIIPPLDIIEKYNHKVCSIFDEQLKLLKENDELTKVRDYLLPLLMNGQITIN